MLDNEAADLRVYKASKAYNYCKQGWHGEIFYHPISDLADLSMT